MCIYRVDEDENVYRYHAHTWATGTQDIVDMVYHRI